MSTNTSFFMNAQAVGLGQVTESADDLHRRFWTEITDPALTETQFLGFNIPEAGIIAINYLWHRPNLGIVTGGSWAWQGVKQHSLASEILDMQIFPDEQLREAGYDDLTLPNSYHVEVLKPLERMRISYADPQRDNAFDVTLTAIMPPAMIPSGKHFDQAMRTQGFVRLRGEEHRIDGYTVRDRSWGETRPEQPRLAPPVHWITAVFSEDLVIHVTGVEGPQPTPVWQELYDWDETQTRAMNRGWIWRDGALLPLQSATVTADWDLRTGYPRTTRLDVVDAEGRPYKLHGTMTAASNWAAWAANSMRVSLVRWEMDGRTGWGDDQVAIFDTFAHQLLG